MKQRSSHLSSVLVTVLLLTVFGLVVLLAAGLKEDSAFWRDAGGYSRELRALVRDGFYPATGIYFFGLFLGTIIAWRLLTVGSQSAALLLAACGLNWLLFLTISTVVVWNNIDNMLHGFPMHYHAP